MSSADAQPSLQHFTIDRDLLEAKVPRIVIVGGGFAGLAAAHALRHSDAELVVIARRNHHIFQPLLSQVATAVLSPSEIAAPIRELEAASRDVTALLTEEIDIADRSR